jgi:hypothetical protein
MCPSDSRVKVNPEAFSHALAAFAATHSNFGPLSRLLRTGLIKDASCPDCGTLFLLVCIKCDMHTVRALFVLKVTCCPPPPPAASVVCLSLCCHSTSNGP